MAFERFIAAVDAAGDLDPHAFVVRRGGRLIASHAWHPWSLDNRRLVYSVSKPFTGTAVGFAASEGLLDLDDPALSFFPEVTNAGPNARAWTVRHLLTMATGQREDPVHQMTILEDAVGGFFGAEPEDAPGTIFRYNNGASWMLGEIVRRVSGGTLMDYLRPRLLDPLELDITWDTDAWGRELGASGVHIRPDDLTRFADLYRTGGVLDGRRILPEGWAEQASAKQIGTDAEPKFDSSFGYGFQMWRAREGFRFSGLYGQIVLMLPERDATVAILSAEPNAQPLLDLAFDLLVPEIADAEPSDPTFGASPSLPDEGASGPWASGRPELDESLAGWSDRAFEVGGTREDSQFFLPDLREVRVERAASDNPESDTTCWRLTLVEPDRTWTASTTHSTESGWVRTSLDADGVRVPVAVDAGSDLSGGVRVDVAFVETPHILHLLVDADGRATMAWNVSPAPLDGLQSLRAGATPSDKA